MTSLQRHSIFVRNYDPSDAARCLTLFDSNVGKYFAGYERARFEAFLEDSPRPYLILEHENEIVACGGYAPHRSDPSIAVFCWGMVHQIHHKSGFGRYLTEARLRRVERDKRFTRIRLRTSQHTAGFYEKLGFQIVETTAEGIAPGIDECIMERDQTGA